MTSVMAGVRILEVAEHTFVPAASAALADLGAEVIKIEHVERGDAMRGLASTGVADLGGDVHVLLEHSNRGKRSLALDLTAPEGIELLYKIAATCDVFLTNKLPSVRKKLNIEVDQIRAHNPKIIYARGTGQGERGPDADKGSYDALAFWARAGVARGQMQATDTRVPGPPAPGFGDSIGGMTIAGGIMGALYHRERTGEATIVDVSLLGTGMWAMGQAIALSQLMGIPWMMPPDSARRNPLTGNYLTNDGHWIALICLQAGKYWPGICKVIGQPGLATDPRFSDHVTLMEHCGEAMDILHAAFATKSVAEWREALETFDGQWTVVQDTVEAIADRQSVANDYVQECENSKGIAFGLVSVPVQYDEAPAKPRRAPEFNEHGDAILEELGLDWDAIIDLKVRGIVA